LGKGANRLVGLPCLLRSDVSAPKENEERHKLDGAQQSFNDEGRGEETSAVLW
jgi:hypothetical protein